MTALVDKIKSIVDSCNSIDQIDNAEQWVAGLIRKKTVPPGSYGLLMRHCLKRRKLIKGRKRVRIFKTVRA